MTMIRVPRWAWITLAALALLAAALLGAAAWVWRSESAFGWALARVPGLEAADVQGRPTGGALGIGRLAWQGEGLRVEVDGLSWRDARWRWRPHPGAWIGVELDAPKAREVRVTTTPKPPSTEPARAPEALRLPVAATLRGLDVGALRLNEQPPLTGLRADVEIGAEQGAAHRIERFTVTREGVVAQADLRVGSAAPLTVGGGFSVAAAPGASPSWQARGRLGGTLERLHVVADAQEASGAQAGVDATLAPFAAWPLVALAANVSGIDLAALSPALPSTRLSGRATMEGGASASATVLAIDAANDAPGSWDAGRLPVRTIEARLRGLPGQPDGVTFERASAVLAGPGDAGTLQASGRWQGDTLSIDAALAGVRPRALDARAPAMVLEGPVRLSLRGLAAAGATPAPPAPAPLAGEATLALTGRLAAPRATPVSVASQAQFERAADGTLRLVLRQLEARAAEARATASLDATRAADGSWRTETRGELVRFDPAVWWPAFDPRARGSVLNGRWQATLALPPAPSLAALRGDARVTIDDSRMAGLPVRGAASLLAGEQSMQVDSELRAGDARLLVNGRSTAAASATQWRIDLRAPSLATFAPLLLLAPAGVADWLPQRGALSVVATMDGRWPAVALEGALAARDLRGPAVSADRIEARWKASANVDAPLLLVLDVTGLAQGERRLDRVRGRIDGTLRAHRAHLDAATPLRPPAWAEAMAGTPQPGGSTWQLDVNGAWSPQSAGGGAWRGNIEQLQAAPRGGGTAWLEARQLDAMLALDASGRPVRAGLAPGRVALLGGAVRWQAAQWQAGAPGAAPRIALDAVVEPLRIAPLLARLQPQFAWRGDLALGARIAVNSGERFDADIVLERTGGDLGLTANGAPRTLGLSDLRVALAAHGGTWHMTQALAGKQVGVLAGSQSLRMPPGAAFPAPDTPLEGGLELRIPDLAVWAPWLPPGWRIGGQLHATASLGGRAGAPAYRGRIEGEALEAQHLFQGVHLQDGTLAVSLRGDDATIERLEFRDGPRAGTLRVEGRAGFGDAPRAQLRAVLERFRALDRVDRNVTVSGSADVSFQGQRVQARGRFEVEHGLIDVTQSGAPSLDDDIVVVNDPQGDPAVLARLEGKPANSSDAPAQADVDVSVDLGKALRLRGRGIDAMLQGSLRASTERGKLGVIGNVRIVNGTYKAYQQNLSIERGVLSFSGDVTNPRLDVLAVRPDIDTRVGVMVSGTAVAPRVRLYSEPELPDIDKLTWLVMGRGPEGVGQADTALLQRAALALLSGDRTQDEGFLHRLGLDSVSVRRAESGDTEDTVLGLGKQLSRRLYVGYERALATAGGTWQLIYRVAQRFTVRAQAGDENTVDVIWTWRWE